MKIKLFWAAALGFVCLALAPVMALQEAAPNGPAPGKQPAAAADAVQTPPGTPAAAKAAYTPKYLEAAVQAIKYLSAILARQDRLEQKKLEETSKDITRLNEKLQALLGPEMINELETEGQETAARTSLDNP